jgi:hypothetical protein
MVRVYQHGALGWSRGWASSKAQTVVDINGLSVRLALTAERCPVQKLVMTRRFSRDLR